MQAQTQESKRAGMEAFLDIYEEFVFAMAGRELGYDMVTSEKISLFAIYVGRME